MPIDPASRATSDPSASHESDAAGFSDALRQPHEPTNRINDASGSGISSGQRPAAVNPQPTWFSDQEIRAASSSVCATTLPITRQVYQVLNNAYESHENTMDRVYDAFNSDDPALTALSMNFFGTPLFMSEESMDIVDEWYDQEKNNLLNWHKDAVLSYQHQLTSTVNRMTTLQLEINSPLTSTADKQNLRQYLAHEVDSLTNFPRSQGIDLVTRTFVIPEAARPIRPHRQPTEMSGPSTEASQLLARGNGPRSIWAPALRRNQPAAVLNLRSPDDWTSASYRGTPALGRYPR